MLIPLHLAQNHWALMAIDLAGKKFMYFDAMHPTLREANRHGEILWRWICDEAKRRGYTGLPWSAEEAPASEGKTSKKSKKKKKQQKKKKKKKQMKRAACTWEVIAVGDAPRQHNGYDCGVFMLMFARSIALSGRAGEGLRLSVADWSWGQRDMLAIRQRIAADLTAKDRGNDD